MTTRSKAQTSFLPIAAEIDLLLLDAGCGEATVQKEPAGWEAGGPRCVDR